MDKVAFGVDFVRRWWRCGLRDWRLGTNGLIILMIFILRRGKRLMRDGIRWSRIFQKDYWEMKTSLIAEDHRPPLTRQILKAATRLNQIAHLQRKYNSTLLLTISIWKPSPTFPLSNSGRGIAWVAFTSLWIRLLHRLLTFWGNSADASTVHTTISSMDNVWAKLVST